MCNLNSSGGVVGYGTSSKEQFEVLPGTLLRLMDGINGNGNVEFFLETCEHDKPIILKCVPGEVENLSSLNFELLKPIPNCKERLEVYTDKDWLNDGRRLKINDSVYVKLKPEQSELEGVLRYKGTDPENKGIYFGVELKEKKGNSDGEFKKYRFFNTGPDHAVFVALHKIRKRREDWHKSSRLRADEDGEGLYQQQETVKCSLHIGERIVWVSDDGPQRGTVRWIGYLPGERERNITVGVEFDNQIGTGTGKYRDKRLFYTKPGFASLIPLIGLIKEIEFENPAGPTDITDITELTHTSPEFIQGQKQMLEAYANSNSASSYDNKRSPHDKFAEPMQVNLGLPAYNQHYTESTHNQDIPLYAVESKHRIGESSGLNPIYDLKLQEESSSGTRSSNSSSFGRGNEPDPDLAVGSMVEVQLKTPLYGVIRWIGNIDDQGKRTAGLEMEEELSAGTDGTYRGQRFFTCAPKKALFIPLYKCSKDKRFHTLHKRTPSTDFGGPPTPDLRGDIPPPECNVDPKMFCGKNRGIQGHHNSCYLDATLFSMFYFTTVFDFIFNRPPGEGDLPEYTNVQQVLKEGIVNPLRKNYYVRADKVLKLRELLDKLGTIPGMMGEEKDPEEFLSSLLTQIMKADPLLHLSSGEHTYFYQLFMEKDENLLLPTTQKLVELSFLQGNVKLKEIPSCLMIQMPRFGKDYKMFHRIVPSLLLDITHILESSPRDCIVCGALATYECKNCYQVQGPGLNSTAFCDRCVKTSHQHMSRRNHKPEPIATSQDFLSHYEEELQKAKHGDEETHCITLPRETMELFAVICIQTSHYVSFVKCGSGKQAPWVFFDSMADRMGEQGGYNIPEVTFVPELSNWLDEKNLPNLLQMGDDKNLPEHLRRILCDGYMCMYQSTEVMMFQ
ncbi:ubiquitin carboxyl-terminal hydrolase CYLD-like isoform X2 [Physella acuta]|uniref:ubiquitin carboxyl-terminal hydrolase CYLD-like isoform X2 n=1 Tax=Physella acuta TaxID=109671 RepID=UPI0027DD705B|nr:ubiquitin carboxyl-terminal hydrolase CYLD-like isoform X2 [Physella acuta]